MFSSSKKASKTTCLLVGALLSLSAAYGQRAIDDGTSLSLSDRLYYGGGFDLGGSSNYFNIGLSPVVGYMISPRLSAGVGILWRYTHYGVENLSINQYGGHVFARYNILPELFAYSEMGFFNTPTSLRAEGRRTSIFRAPIGLGYSAALGYRGAFVIMALYDVAYNRSAIGNVYGSPWGFRINFIY